MRPIRHIPKSLEGMKKAIERGLVFYHTTCGSVASLPDLVSREDSDCGACALLFDARVKEAEEERLGALEKKVETTIAIDLSDWDDLDSPTDGGHPGADVTTTPPNTPPPPMPFSYEVLCDRLALDPATDPQGKLGCLERDVREVLTPAERSSAAAILSMVRMVPAGAPLVETVYRLCHELTWHRQQASSHRSSA